MLKQKPPARNIELSLAYAGTHFFGWQIQPDRRTVQGELNKALRRILNLSTVRTIASSRTDSGVHAHDQRVSLTLESPIPPESLKIALNHKLPTDVRVREVRCREDGFSARYGARAKHYAFFIFNGKAISPFISDYAWRYGRPLDAEAMDRGAASWVGTRCFRAFQSHKDKRIGSETTIFECRVGRLGPLLVFDILGQHFLYHMVRNMVASLVKLGTGDWSMAEFQERSLSGERKRQWITAPARGLHLFEVFFGSGPFALSQKGVRMGETLNQLNAGISERMPAAHPLSMEAEGRGSHSAFESDIREDPGSF